MRREYADVTSDSDSESGILTAAYANEHVGGESILYAIVVNSSEREFQPLVAHVETIDSNLVPVYRSGAWREMCRNKRQVYNTTATALDQLHLA